MAHWHSRLAQFLTADYCPRYIHWPPWSTPNPGQQLRIWASRYQGCVRRSFMRQVFYEGVNPHLALARLTSE